MNTSQYQPVATPTYNFNASQSVPQPAAQPAQQTAQQILGTIFTLMSEQDEKLKKLCQEQLVLLQNPTIEPFNALVAQQYVRFTNFNLEILRRFFSIDPRLILFCYLFIRRLLKEQMDIELRSIAELNQKVILDPPDLARLTHLTTELQLQMRQLELYHAELQQLLGQNQTPPVIAALVIKKQPFPTVISKLKQLGDDQLTILLLTGAMPNFQIQSTCKATLLGDTATASSSKGKNFYFCFSNFFIIIIHLQLLYDNLILI